jgi:dipeptidyl aminopeptidase/acylaminoacyl peptidase
MEKLVTFNSNGRRIYGNLHLPYEGAPCIITLHGLESSKDSRKWLSVAKKLYDEGFACLRFNFQGCGEGLERSEGEFEDTSLTQRIRDYRSAIDFLWSVGKVDIGRIGVIGSSFGGMVAIAAQEKRVKAIVTLATPYKITYHQAQKLENFYMLPSGRRIKRSFYEDLEKYDILKAIKHTPPILILHGSLDELVPVEHAYKLHEAAPHSKLEVIEGADHTFSKEEHLNKAIKLSLEWFKKHLLS